MTFLSLRLKTDGQTKGWTNVQVENIMPPRHKKSQNELMAIRLTSLYTMSTQAACQHLSAPLQHTQHSISVQYSLSDDGLKTGKCVVEVTLVPQTDASDQHR